MKKAMGVTVETQSEAYEAYKELRRSILIWRLESICYRYLNIFLYVISRVGVPTLTGIITANLLYQTSKDGFISDIAMIILSISVFALSGVDTLFRPGEKKKVAHRQYNILSDLLIRLEVDYGKAMNDEKGEVIKIYSHQFKEIQDNYSENGFS